MRRRKVFFAIRQICTRNTRRSAMSLSRLRKKRENTVASSQPTDVTVHLPLSVVEAFREHPLLQATGVSVKEVHACLVVMLSGHPPSLPQQPVPNYTPMYCIACKGTRIEIDHRAGDYICNSCGVVQPSRVMENSFQRPVEASAGRASSSNFRLPVWATLRDDYYWVFDHEYEIEHFNCFVNHSTDDIERCKAYARKSLLDKRASPTARVVAALILPILRKKVDLDALKQSMSSGNAIDLPDLRPPQPTFPCPRCNALTFCASDAKRHPCNWGRKRKR